MRRATEIPHHVWPFEAPVVPNFVVSKVSLLVKREVEIVEATFLDHRHRFRDVLSAEWHQEILQHTADAIFLLCGHVGNRQARFFRVST